MTKSWTRANIESVALATAVGLLDALLDAAAALRPGYNAAQYAADLSLLGDGADQAAFDLWDTLDRVEVRDAA